MNFQPKWIILIPVNNEQKLVHPTATGLKLNTNWVTDTDTVPYWDLSSI